MNSPKMEESVEEKAARVGFAKLVGGGRKEDQYIRKYDVILGRTNKNKPVDIILGDLMSVSRHHAKMSYDFQKRATFDDI